MNSFHFEYLSFGYRYLFNKNIIEPFKGSTGTDFAKSGIIHHWIDLNESLVVLAKIMPIVNVNIIVFNNPIHICNRYEFCQHHLNFLKC